MCRPERAPDRAKASITLAPWYKVRMDRDKSEDLLRVRDPPREYDFLVRPGCVRGVRTGVRCADE